MNRPVGKYRAALNKIAGPLPRMYGVAAVMRVVGFFVIWHMLGGDEAMKKAGWSDTTIWRAHRDFRIAFGTTVEKGFPELAAVAESMGGRDVAE